MLQYQNDGKAGILLEQALLDSVSINSEAYTLIRGVKVNSRYG